jgi:hypothetical protein
MAECQTIKQSPVTYLEFGNDKQGHEREGHERCIEFASKAPAVSESFSYRAAIAVTGRSDIIPATGSLSISCPVVGSNAHTASGINDHVYCVDNIPVICAYSYDIVTVMSH